MPDAADRRLRISQNLAALVEHLEECVDIASRGSDAFFGRDFVIRYAAHSALIQAGNAVKDLPADFIADHPEVRWSGLARMRDRIGHGSGSGIDFRLIWSTIDGPIQQDLDALRRLRADV